ncbi:MAG TPA: chloride channel protein [Sphingomicrobium sp.]|nr:chloride channel protein [Sphingomicrobium sp.]
MPSAAAEHYSRSVTSVRSVFRSSEAAVIVLAVAVGIAAGLLTILIHGAAHGLQSAIYGFAEESLSASSSVPVARLLALPFAGLLLGFGSRAAIRRWRTPVDVVEANALHGGVIPWRDSALVCVQTLLSNGAGASVGLEAAYGQAGGGVASLVGSWLRLRRGDLRTLVGAGAGAAIGAAFSAPLAGAFYGFEIVLGAYTPAAIAPVGAACISAVLVVRLLGFDAYVTALPGARAITTTDYLLYAGLGVVCALIAIAIMRAVTWIESRVRAVPMSDVYRPAIGGLFLIPLALITPQALSAGHGALHIDLGAQMALRFLAMVLFVKIAASAVSLGFGFRGGLFFASLFVGSLVGQLFAGLLAQFPAIPILDPSDAALIGMAAMGVAIVGGPMTMSMLVLETTHDFALTGVAVVASLCASTLVRETFGFSFSTWRLHTRGENIRSARDVSWVRNLSAGKMMQRSTDTVFANETIASFRRRFPLGSTGRVVVVNQAGLYLGIVETAKAFDPELQLESDVGELANTDDPTLAPADDVRAVMAAFDKSEAQYLAVIDENGSLLGTLSERFVRRRYAEEIEKAQRDLFGE